MDPKNNPTHVESSTIQPDLTDDETCLEVITAAVTDEPGIVGLEVDFDREQVSVDYDADQVSESAVTQLTQNLTPILQDRLKTSDNALFFIIGYPGIHFSDVEIQHLSNVLRGFPSIAFQNLQQLIQPNSP